MDVAMPELNGIEATRRIAGSAPHARVIALSMHKDSVYVREILRAGAVIERLWISPRVPLLHLAKLEVPATGYAMMVAAFGKDAAPRILLPSEPTKRIGVESIGRNADAGR